MDIASIAIGLVVGFVVAWIARGHGLRAQTDSMRTQMERTISALSADALRDNRQAVVELAEQVLKAEREHAKGDLAQRQQAIESSVKPVAQALEKLDVKLNHLERARVGAFSSLEQQIISLEQSGADLRGETALLARALRSPGTRGRWGEMHLRRVVEMAGLQNRCDFFEQHVVDGEAGRIRPDLVIQLAGGRSLVVDSKVPLDAFLEALESDSDEARAGHLRQHATHLRGHVKTLGQKAYWDQFEAAPEFVLLFLPGDHFLNSALEVDPSLREDAVRQRVHIVTPTTLIPLLQVVAHSWREEALAENARQISTLGAELHKRVADMAGHWFKMGKQLGGTVEAYNKAVGSLETRVLVTARKLSELEAAHVTSGEIPPPTPMDAVPRLPQAAELLDFDVEVVHSRELVS
jgi:DNA recombination protein RmuC